jgi:hypothetical protein
MKEFLDYQIFKIGKITLEVNQLLLLIVFAVAVKYLLAFVKKSSTSIRSLTDPRNIRFMLW